MGERERAGAADDRTSRIGTAIVFWTWTALIGAGLVVVLSIPMIGR